MAKYVIPPKGGYTLLIKCRECKALYSPEKRRLPGSSFFEHCPVCGCDSNSAMDRIPLWKYNLIRFWRSLSSNEGE